MREGKKVLTISSDLQIHFDENGRAGYLSFSGKTSESVEEEVQRWQQFVADWLEAHEPPKRERKRSREELQFLKFLREFVSKMPRRARRAGRPATEIEGAVRSLFKAMADVCGFTPEQIDKMASEVFGTLQ